MNKNESVLPSRPKGKKSLSMIVYLDGFFSLRKHWPRSKQGDESTLKVVNDTKHLWPCLKMIRYLSPSPNCVKILVTSTRNLDFVKANIHTYFQAMAVVVWLSDRSKTNSMTSIIFSAEVFKWQIKISLIIKKSIWSMANKLKCNPMLVKKIQDE